MKTKLFLILSLSILILISCEDENAITQNNKKQILNSDQLNKYKLNNNNFTYDLKLSDFDFVGDIHNNGVQYVYNNYFALNQYNYGNTSNTQLVSDLAANSFEYIFENDTYFSTNNFNTSDLNVVSQNINYNLYFPNNNYNTLLSNYLTTDQKLIIDTLFSQITSSSTPQIALNRIDILAEYANNNLPDDDQIIIFMTMSVAKKSIVYWSGTNGQNWLNKAIENGKYENTIPPQAINWQNVAKADAGALMGSMVQSSISLAGVTAICAGVLEGLIITGGNPIGGLAGGLSAALGNAGRAAIAGAVGASCAAMILG